MFAAFGCCSTCRRICTADSATDTVRIESVFADHAASGGRPQEALLQLWSSSWQAEEQVQRTAPGGVLQQPTRGPLAAFPPLSAEPCRAADGLGAAPWPEPAAAGEDARLIEEDSSALEGSRDCSPTGWSAWEEVEAPAWPDLLPPLEDLDYEWKLERSTDIEALAERRQASQTAVADAVPLHGPLSTIVEASETATISESTRGPDSYLDLSFDEENVEEPTMPRDGPASSTCAQGRRSRARVALRQARVALRGLRALRRGAAPRDAEAEAIPLSGLGGG